MKKYFVFVYTNNEAENQKNHEFMVEVKTIKYLEIIQSQIEILLHIIQLTNMKGKQVIKLPRK